MAAQRETSYEVKIWTVTKATRRKGTSYRLRWSVGGRRKSKTYATRALADSKRAELVTAARRGEAFDVETGWPISTLPNDTSGTWWESAVAFALSKWRELAPTSRRSLAEALATASLAMLDDARSGPPDRALRSAMFGWGFNGLRHAAGPPPAEHAEAVIWLERHTRKMTDLNDPTVMRGLLEAITRQNDGSTAAATTVARKRAVLHQMLERAVEQGIFEANPMSRVRWKPPRVADTFDPRAAVNPDQARALLAAVAEIGRQGEAKRAASPRSNSEPIIGAGIVAKRLEAFFALLYYAALRPGEAMALKAQDVQLPPVGAPDDSWGELLLSANNPEISRSWSDTDRRTARRLKHRAEGVVRPVPSAPPLVRILRSHLESPGPADDGRLFYGPYGGTISATTYADVWDRARRVALSDAEYKSPLAARPYDLRHAVVSGWLAAGVDSALVAAWAGHSVAVLHRVYAHVIHGRQDEARQRVERFLRVVDQDVPSATTST